MRAAGAQSSGRGRWQPLRLFVRRSRPAAFRFCPSAQRPRCLSSCLSPQVLPLASRAAADRGQVRQAWEWRRRSVLRRQAEDRQRAVSCLSLHRENGSSRGSPGRSGDRIKAAIPVPRFPVSLPARTGIDPSGRAQIRCENPPIGNSRQPAIHPTSRGFSECCARKRRAAWATPSGTHRWRATCCRT